MKELAYTRLKLRKIIRLKDFKIFLFIRMILDQQLMRLMKKVIGTSWPDILHVVSIKLE
jgi:hypothetical protein